MPISTRAQKPFETIDDAERSDRLKAVRGIEDGATLVSSFAMSLDGKAPYGLSDDAQFDRQFRSLTAPAAA
ncbi:hypothetical protein J2X13_001780 [Aminobacter aminovorans]|nr:hypothetical protein [Aminobacter aminovorans]